MNFQSFAELLALGGAMLLFSPPLAAYLERVYTGRPHPLSFLKPVEDLLYRLAGLETEAGDWRAYARALLSFSFLSLVFLMALLMGQGFLPLNPRHFPGLSWHLAFNTAVSFVTNTNWQAYSGESTLSYLSQAAGLGVQNFLSAAAGIAVMLALFRGIFARGQESLGDRAPLGNFWSDMTKTIVYLLLPLSLLLALFLVSQGVVQSLSDYVPFQGLAGKDGFIPLGPAAGQIAIKQLGTNGGGFFGQNSAHPFENPSPLTNFVELLAIVAISASLPLLYGRFSGNRRQGRSIFGVMFLLFALGVGVAVSAELAHGSLEGKELRFGLSDSALWAVTTTATSNGSVDAMHDSLAPLAGMIPMLNIMLGELVFGGLGSGMYGMLAMIFVAVFIAGLMVGRGPEYMGKKIGAREVQLSMTAIVLPNIVILLFSAIAASSPAALRSLGNPGAHGLSEILYAFSSAAGNNGSAFAGLGANTVFWDLSLGLGMLIGRFGVILPLLAAAGGLAGAKTIPQSAGSFRTDTPVFAVLLVSVILIVAGLTHFPALSLGPILDHLNLLGARP